MAAPTLTAPLVLEPAARRGLDVVEHGAGLARRELVDEGRGGGGLETRATRAAIAQAIAVLRKALY